MFSSQLLFQRAETALLGEKANKLFGIAQFLDLSLGDGYNACLIDTEKVTLDNPELKLRKLFNTLQPIVDRLCHSFPGLGAGYYSLELDCIIVYGPTGDYGDLCGFRVTDDHMGRRCMKNRRPISSVGSMVRGEIMNCVMPIIRNGTVEGYVWANETVEDVYKQMTQGGMNMFLSNNIDPLLGLSGLLIMACQNLLEKENSDSAKFLRYIRLFLNSLRLSAIVIDNEGIVHYCSHRLSALGIDSYKYEGNRIELLFKDLEFRDGVEMKRKLYSSQGEYQFKKVKIGNPSKQINVIMAALANSHQEWMGYVTIFEDMKMAQLEEKEIRRTEAINVVEQLAASMAHEIQNPLTILREAVKMIPKRIGDVRYLERFSQVALTEINHVEKVARSLSELTRYSKPELFEFDVIKVIERAVELIRYIAEKQQINIVEQYESNDSVIIGDAEHLYRAFLNLMINSVQAMPQGGTLFIHVKGNLDQKLLYIKIRDTGKGVLPEIEQKIFEPFFTTKNTGTGLGLTIVQSIISKHNGILSFESGYGTGTVFTISLPKQQILKNSLRGAEEDAF